MIVTFIGRLFVQIDQTEKNEWLFLDTFLL